MFWGLILKSNKRYSQTVSKTFHLSQASLDTSTCGDEDIQVMLTSEDSTYILCTLKKKGVNQCNLDLNFAEGDKIAFCSKGNGTVHLTGYLILPDLLDGYPVDESDESEEEEIEKEVNTKKKVVKNDKILSEDDHDDEDASDDDDENVEGKDSDDDDDDDDDDEEEDEDDSDDDEEEEEEPKLKMPKLDIKGPKTNGLDKSKDIKQEKNKNKKQNEQKNNENAQGGPKTLQGGVHVEELKVGNGPVAKAGKRIGVYYEGRLKQNNKVFDSSKSGPGFKFVLGRGEVIRGWDVGVAGMKVGGKRRITCPPAMAYGAKGSPPAIPPNSTLIFDVEVKNVN